MKNKAKLKHKPFYRNYFQTFHSNTFADVDDDDDVVGLKLYIVYLWHHVASVDVPVHSVWKTIEYPPME